ncbi:MAG: helix-turn-helix domain-containing protein [Armatimonadota bacterium]|nr:helix-turn-helix domain-containing protein [Armatimonadota bacterium]MDR7574356.1 helix-turn-helix domain-containing protein [Armatimonadota bacterium]
MDGKLDVLEEGVLSVPEAARLLGVSRTTLYNFLQAGRLPSLRLGGRRLIPRRALVALLAEALESSWQTDPATRRRGGRS